MQHAPTPDILVLDWVRIDLAAGRVERDGLSFSLSAREVELLGYLAARAGRTVPQDELLREVWGYHPKSHTRAVTHAVARLRKKLEPTPRSPRLLFTEYGRGIRLELPGLKRALPPAPSSGAPRLGGNLPRRQALFHGRGEELAELIERWREGAGLITLRGPGGVGKTRLGIEFGHSLVSVSPSPEGGVWMCELADCESEGEVVHAVAEVLGVAGRPTSRAELRTWVGRVLAARGRCLVVLDNLEQVAESVSETVAGWCRAAPSCSFLVTTRVALDCPGEEIVELRGLSLPAARTVLLDHARRLDPSLSLEEVDDAEILRLVHLLDRLPLALCLAGPRLALLGPRRLAAALGERFRVLRSLRAEGRHGTLEATIAWSWDRLSEGEQRTLSRCSLFRGPFDLADLATLEGGEDSGSVDAVLDATDRVAGLVTCSLVHLEDGRLELLQSVRAFARARFPADEPALRAYVGWALGIALADLRGPLEDKGGRPRPARVEGEVREALAVASRAGWVEEALALAASLDELTAGRTPLPVRLELVDEVLAAPGGPTVARVGLRRARADLLRQLGDLVGAVEELSAVAEPVQGTPVHPRWLLTRGAVAHQGGDLEEARRWYLECLALCEEHSDAEVLGATHINLGVLTESAEGVEPALGHYREAVRILRTTRRFENLATAMLNLAITLRVQGRTGEAQTWATEALELARSRRLFTREAAALLTLGNLALTNRDHTRARLHYEAAARRARLSGAEREAATAAINGVSVALTQGELDTADRVLAELLRTESHGISGLVLANLGLLRRLQGLDHEARQAFEGAMAHAPEPTSWSVLARAHLAATLADLGYPDEASEGLGRARERAGLLGYSDGVELCEIVELHLRLAREGASPELLSLVGALGARAGDHEVAIRVLRARTRSGR